MELISSKTLKDGTKKYIREGYLNQHGELCKVRVITWETKDGKIDSITLYWSSICGWVSIPQD